MRWLLFLSRLAFICNMCFLVSFILKVTDWLSNYDFVSLIIIMGWVLGIIFNPLANIIYLGVFWSKRKIPENVPLWLIVMNILFLILQLVFLFLMNIDKY